MEKKGEDGETKVVAATGAGKKDTQSGEETQKEEISEGKDKAAKAKAPLEGTGSLAQELFGGEKLEVLEEGAGSPKKQDKQ